MHLDQTMSLTINTKYGKHTANTWQFLSIPYIFFIIQSPRNQTSALQINDGSIFHLRFHIYILTPFLLQVFFIFTQFRNYREIWCIQWMFRMNISLLGTPFLFFLHYVNKKNWIHDFILIFFWFLSFHPVKSIALQFKCIYNIYGEKILCGDSNVVYVSFSMLYRLILMDCVGIKRVKISVVLKLRLLVICITGYRCRSLTLRFSLSLSLQYSHSFSPLR